MDAITHFEVRSNRRTVRLDRPGRRYLRVLLRAAAAPETDAAPAAPLHIALVLDRSGSMAGRKWALAREAAAAALALLRPCDRFSVLTFSSDVERVAIDQPVTPKSLGETTARLARAGVGGGTALAPALDDAYALLEECKRDGTLLRVLVLTDGQANIGARAPDAFASGAARAAGLGVLTSAFGLGRDFHEELLVTLTRAGQGQFTYVADERELAAALRREIADAKVVVAERLTLEVRPSKGVRLECISALHTDWLLDHLQVAVGSMVAGQELELVLRAELPAGALGAVASVELRLCDPDGPLPLPVAEVGWVYADEADCRADAPDTAVARVAAEALVAAAEIRLADANRRGDFEAVERQLNGAVAELEQLGALDAGVQAQIVALQEVGERLRRRLSDHMLKEQYMASVSKARGRNIDGSSKLH